MTDKQRALTPREEAMERIANSARETLNKEIKEAGGTSFVELNTQVAAAASEDDDPADREAEAARKALEAGEALHKGTSEDEQQLALQREQQEQADAEAERARLEAEAATGKASATSIDPAAKMKLRVNGADVEITYEEAQRRLQKDVSADLRLEEASRVMREAQALQQSIQQQQQEAADAAAAAAKGGNPNGVVVDPDATRKFTEALFKGDSEAATLAFNEAVSSAVKAAKTADPGRGNATPQVDPQAIAAQVRQQIAIDSALERSKQDYPDLYADPDIEAVAASKIERAVKGGKPFVAALDEVQSELATKFGWKRASGTPTRAVNTDRRSEKQARKEGMEPPVPSTAAKSATQEEVQASVSDTIREMAKARGQHVVM